MASTRRDLMALIERSVISPEQVSRAVKVAGLHPSSRAWAVFVDRLLLWLGGLALAFAVLFFVAYNWAEMGRWLRFGVVQAALVLVVGVAVWGNTRQMGTQVALTAASLLVGVLLALVGQVYQTGADPWQLFLIWALLTLPWVGVARFELLWVLWLGLLNLAIGLYFRTWGGPFGVLAGSDTALWGLFGLNTLALAIREEGARYRGWPRQWALRLLAIGSGVPITLLTMFLIMDADLAWSPVVAIYPLWLASLYGVYRYWRPDLFMIAGGCISLLIVATLLLARVLLWGSDWQEGSLILIAIAVLAMGGRSGGLAEAATSGDVPVMNSMNDLKVRLSQAGIALHEPATPAPLETPWFVRVLQAFSGWLAALFLLGFIAMGMVFLVESPTASLTVGIVMLSAAFGLFRQARSDLLEHLALAISFAGQLLIAWALIEFWGESAYPLWPLLGWSLLGLQCVLALVMPSQIHRTFSAFAATLALYMALAMSAMALVASGLVLLALTLLWLNEFRWPERIRDVQAWGYGLLVGLLVVQGLAHSDQSLPLLDGMANSAWAELTPWLNVALLALALLLVFLNVFQHFSSTRERWAAYACAAALLIMSVYVPSVGQGVVVMLLGFAIGHRLLLGTGVLSLLLGIGSYYYWLDATLLMKSFTLLIIGGLLLLLRWALRQWPRPPMATQDNGSLDRGA